LNKGVSEGKNEELLFSSKLNLAMMGTFLSNKNRRQVTLPSRLRERTGRFGRT